MVDFTSSAFQTVDLMPADTRIVFVADMFADQYTGGAELTTQALIDACPEKYCKLTSKQVSMALLAKGKDKLWVFGNFAQLNPQLIPSIVANINYVVLEYDYKYCRYRSPEKHKSVTGQECSCQNELSGKLISTFYHAAKVMFWMSESQKAHYFDRFPFLREGDNIVLSSVFKHQTLAKMKILRKNAPVVREGWIVLGSNSWIKGANVAEEWCKSNGKEYKIVWNLSYDELLSKLSRAEGFVYLPLGMDTCPRMVIEAKLLGCKLELNDNVQHANEEWFTTDDLTEIERYLYASPQTFWNAIRVVTERKVTISGYTTTLNCIEQEYPFEKSIESMLAFCDEVCVVDGGSTDGTYEILLRLAAKTVMQGSKTESVPKLKIKKITRDLSHPRFALFDGMQKAEARKMCSSEFCWQMDSDELVHEDDADKIKKLALDMPKSIDLVALPVTEFWGGPDKVRLDVTPWKWRLSRNKSTITHGIPKHLRKFDSNGDMYAAPGTDGCDMIDEKTGDPIPFMNFFTPDIDNIRQAALQQNTSAITAYQQWFEAATTQLPGVFHYSWYNIGRKIRLYRTYWGRHWSSLYSDDPTHVIDENMFFDVSWDQVADQMINDRAIELATKLGGWIWHKPWDGNTLTPWLKPVRSQPALATDIMSTITTKHNK